jgi:putative pyruvate formate lyase activating enzyme
MKAIYQIGEETIFHDPGPEMIPVFAALDESYRIQSVQPGPGFIPSFQRLRQKRVAIDEPLMEMEIDELKAVFSGDHGAKGKGKYHYSGLDVLSALSHAALRECRLCGWECGMNRYQQPSGRCGLTNKAYCSRPFIHIAEEPLINPAIVTNFGGCALRCVYCIDHKLWDASVLPEAIPSRFWAEVQTLQNQYPDIPVNTLEFTNPTENLPAILDILSKAPGDFNLPVVMNCHLYGSKNFYELAEPVTDVWLPDLRYGNDDCAKRLSGADGYMEVAELGLDAMAKGDAEIIVRILVLPGHVECCHERALKMLARYKERLSVSILDQYVPEHNAHHHEDLGRRPTCDEIGQVKHLLDLRHLKEGQRTYGDLWR